MPLSTIVAEGWTDGTFFWRRLLFAGALAAACNAALLAVAARPLASVIAGLVCSALLAIRYGISSFELGRIEEVVRRDLMRLRYPDLMDEVDSIIQEELDHLIRMYAAGLDVAVDPFEDLEPQLRSNLDDAITEADKHEVELNDVLDLPPLRETFRPSSN
jgi:hypothetical protein